jgi:hypothetical protein
MTVLLNVPREHVAEPIRDHLEPTSDAVGQLFAVLRETVRAYRTLQALPQLEQERIEQVAFRVEGTVGVERQVRRLIEDRRVGFRLPSMLASFPAFDAYSLFPAFDRRRSCGEPYWQGRRRYRWRYDHGSNGREGVRESAVARDRRVANRSEETRAAGSGRTKRQSHVGVRNSDLDKHDS